MLDFENGPTLEAWHIAWGQLRSAAPSDGLGALLPNVRGAATCSIQTELLASRALSSIPLLVASARQIDVAASLTASIPLIGAGPGLTPSWDDFLIGYICGLRATAATSWKRARFLARFGEAVRDASTVTSAVSRSYIQRAVAGHGPEWIEDALAAIAAGDSGRTVRTTARALRIGNTSGSDMMLGVILGSSTWQTSTETAEVLAALSFRRCEHLPMRNRHAHPAAMHRPG